MVKQEEGGKGAAILERRRPPPLAKKLKEEEKLRIYAWMPDGSLLSDLAKLPETIESYRNYFR